MARELKFQDPGEGIHEGEVSDVLVSVGDEVQEGDNVLVVETDKATTDLPSPYSGKIEEIRVEAGDVVKVGDVMITFASGDEEAADEEAADEEAADEEADEEEAADEEADEEEADEGKEDEQKEQQDEAAAREEKQQDKEEMKEEEPKEAERKSHRSGGKAAAVGELPEYEEKAKKSKQQQTDKEHKAERPVPASPATRRLARELNVDLREIKPSGPHGRVIDDDVRAAAEEKPAKEEEKPSEEKPAEEKRPARTLERPPLPNFEQWGPVEREPLKGIRRQTARQMTLSWQEIPHVTHHDLIDITELERWRRKKNAEIESAGGRLSLMVLVMKAVASVLTRHPRFNASFDPNSQELILKRYCHLGVAVDTDDGLVVGVVRDVDRQPIAQLAAAVDEMVNRVRNHDVDAEELKGSTFTVTNVGPLGGVAFEPLVNYPEVAILGMARARLQQVITGDLEAPETAVRYMLPLSLSYDHRVNDGADAARFVSDLGESLHDPDALLLSAV